MNVLLTGGAGYIGSHVLRTLAAGGHECTAYDSLDNGHAHAVAGARLVVADVAAAPALRRTLRDNAIDTVIHFAALIEAGESMAAPDKYFRNNTFNALTLLEAMNECGVKRLVFSSTAAVYGNPDRTPIEETDRLAPINPYGASKLAVEYMIRAHAHAFGLGAVCLRYFNVAGADPAGDIGEAHSPETHLIPLVLEAALGKRTQIKIFGDDYDTPDGTCIRDYIHVCDLAAAHVLAAGAIAPGAVDVFNLGNGEGFSVKQVIETCRTVTGLAIPSVLAPRRPGDPARLVASSQKALSQLGWRPQFPSLAVIVAHAWQWHKNHPQGYGDR